MNALMKMDFSNAKRLSGFKSEAARILVARAAIERLASCYVVD